MTCLPAASLCTRDGVCIFRLRGGAREKNTAHPPTTHQAPSAQHPPHPAPPPRLRWPFTSYSARPPPPPSPPAPAHRPPNHPHPPPTVRRSARLLPHTTPQPPAASSSKPPIKSKAPRPTAASRKRPREVEAHTSQTESESESDGGRPARPSAGPASSLYVRAQQPQPPLAPAATPRSLRAQKRQRLSGGGDGDHKQLCHMPPVAVAGPSSIVDAEKNMGATRAVCATPGQRPRGTGIGLIWRRQQLQGHWLSKDPSGEAQVSGG